jgi:tRNA-dihydrouridine synthase
MTTDFTAEVDAFLERTGVAPTIFGRDALGDPNFVKDLRNGRRLWPETEAKVRDYMEKYRAPNRDDGEPPQQSSAAVA